MFAVVNTNRTNKYLFYGAFDLTFLSKWPIMESMKNMSKLELVRFELALVAQQYIGAQYSMDMIDDVQRKADHVLDRHDMRCDVELDLTTNDLVFTIHGLRRK